MEQVSTNGLAAMLKAMLTNTRQDLKIIYDFITEHDITQEQMDEIAVLCNFGDVQIKSIRAFNFTVPPSVLLKKADEINWSHIACEQYMRFNDSDVRLLKDYLDFCKLIRSSQSISEDCLVENMDKFESREKFMHEMSCNQILSEKFLDKYGDEVEWTSVTMQYKFVNKLDEHFVTKYADKVDWNVVSTSSDMLSEEAIEKFSDRLSWYMLSRYRFWEEDEILHFGNKINWGQLSFNMTLPAERYRELRKIVKGY